MLKFVQNLALLGFLGIILIIVAPGMMSQVIDMFNKLGLTPFLIFLVLLSALPRRSRRRKLAQQARR